MARTIEQIKTEITDAFMVNETLASAYGFNEGDKFTDKFSRVSIETLLIYIVASSIWVLEKLFDTHQSEVSAIIAAMKPHSLRWYVNKVKAYRAGQSLVEGTDTYSDDDLSSEEIERMQVVKYAAAMESEATIYIKVATENGGEKQPLERDELEGLKSYLAEIKDAGVNVSIINEVASKLKLSLQIYYNPMVLSSEGKHFATGKSPVEDSIKQYIGNLPFNGEYRNQSLIDAIQQVDGVVIVELIRAEESYNGVDYDSINAKAIPYSGYYAYEDDNITIEYIPYESI